MAHKTFISYKYSESRELRDRIIKALGKDATFYKGENVDSKDMTVNDCSQNDKTELFRIAKTFSVSVIDYDFSSVLLECTQTEKRNNALIELLQKRFLNRLEITRGGSVAVEAIGISEQ